ncbi:hypothetical protein JCM33374_g5243 [Metschnikowia sp. JCM 33374]|nr:hypothetical protein JCM33374_g5243 [Metschnikowia sp. JCM 33374]
MPADQQRIVTESTNSSTPNEWTILGSLVIGSSGFYEESHNIDDFAAREDRDGLGLCSSGRKRDPVCVSFDRSEYETLMLIMIMGMGMGAGCHCILEDT